MRILHDNRMISIAGGGLATALQHVPARVTTILLRASGGGGPVVGPVKEPIKGRFVDPIAARS